VDVYTVPPTAPTASIISVEPELMDRVGTGQVGQDLSVDLGQIVARYAAGTQLDRAQRLTLAIIRDSIRQRPIYFATTIGAMTELGLAGWGVRQGLATKLVVLSGSEMDARGYTKGPPELGAERFDVDRSLALYDKVYLYRGLKDRALWPDRSTLNIPWQFYALSFQLADAVQRHEGGAAVVERLRADALNFQVTAEGGMQGRAAAGT
jgi:hypothetical protein